MKKSNNSTLVEIESDVCIRLKKKENVILNIFKSAFDKNKYLVTAEVLGVDDDHCFSTFFYTKQEIFDEFGYVI